MQWTWKIVIMNDARMLLTTLADGTKMVRPCEGATLSQWIKEVDATNSNILNSAAQRLEAELPHPIVDDREVLVDPVTLDR